MQSAKHTATYYAPPSDFNRHQVILRKEEAHHIRVSRNRVGDKIIVTDGRGHAYACNILKIGKNEVVATLNKQLPNTTEPDFSLTLAVAIPKKQRLEWIIEKGTEIGVNHFIPLLTTRTITTTDSIKKPRLEKIALAATKQSCRTTLPQISDPISLSALLEQQHFDICLIAHEQPFLENERNLSQEAEMWKASKTGVVAIGPEGGFTEAEMETAVTSGWLPFWMGTRRLRTETASIVAATLVLSRTGDLA